MSKFLLTLILLISNVSFAQSSGTGCVYYNGKEVPERFLTDSTLVAQCDAKIKAMPKKVKIPPTDEECNQCVAAQKTKLAARGFCGNTKGCSFRQIEGIPNIFGLTYSAQSVVASCDEALTCSEETQQCEFICESDFTYNFDSGFCEKACGVNEIEQNNTCVSCEEGTRKENNECVSICTIEGQTYTNGACACPANQIVANNKCISNTINPCAEFGADFNPYGGTCLGPNPRTSYLSPSLNSNNFRLELDMLSQTSSFTPGISYIGCFNSNGESKALFKHTSSIVEAYAANAAAFPVYSYCADANGAAYYGDTDKTNNRAPLGRYNTWIVTSDYFSMPAVNKCYKYRFIAIDGFSRAELGVISVPYETCAECPNNTAKINGTCGCPAGQVISANGCIDDVICKTDTEYTNGLCTCSKPYKISGFSGNKFTCEQPQYSRFETPASSGQVNVSVNQESCIVSGTRATVGFSFTASGNYGFPVELRVTCMDKSFGPSSSNTQTFGPFQGSSVATMYGTSASGNFTISADGSCYNYKLVANNGYAWLGSADFTISYPACGANP